MKPRVLFLDHVAKLSGAELALLNTLPHLTSVIPHVVLAEEGPLHDEFTAVGISCEILSLSESTRNARRGSIGHNFNFISSGGEIVAYSRKVASLARSLEAHAIYSNSAKAHIYGAITAQLVRVPHIWHIRDQLTRDTYSLAGVGMLKAGSWLFADGLVANSASTLETLPRSGRARSRKRVIPSPVQPDSQPRRERIRTPGDTFTVGIVGRLAAWKGQELFLKAFAERFRDQDCRAVVIGAAVFGEDDYANHLVELTRKLEIDHQVEFRGFQRDIYAEIASLDVLVHASVIPEPFGQVVVQGMAAGVPVIASGEGGPCEIIDHGVNGYLFEPRDAQSLGHYLERVRKEPELHSEMGRRARDVSAAYDPLKIARELDDFLGRVLLRSAR